MSGNIDLFGHFENTVLTKTGEQRFISFHNSFIRNNESNIIGILFSGEDITERKQAEEKLEKERDLLNAIINNIPILLTRYDPEINMVYLNREFEKIVGWTTEEVKNIDMMEKVYPDPDYRQQALEYMQKASTEWREFQIQSKSGKTIDSEWANLHLDDGTQIGIGIDITERKRAENDLRESEEKLSSIINTSPIGICTVDELGYFSTTNLAFEQMVGYSKEECRDLSFFDLTHPSDRPINKKLFQSMFSKKTKGFSVEKRYVRKDGVIISVSVHAIAIADAEGNIKFGTAFVADITERKQVEEEREQALLDAQAANNVKDQFVANISHEVRTPLNSILGFSDLLRLRYHDIISEKDRNVFGYITAAGDRLMRTVDSILNLSLMKAGTINIQKQKLDLCSITIQAVEQLKLSAQNKDLDLSFAIPKKPQIIFADEYCIHQSILNLTDNAIKYTKKGSVKLKCGTRDDRVTLSVIDTGIGISDEYQERIFDAYTQESEGFTKSYQGIGLGLALTKQYIELNDIELEFESKKDIGTTFTLIFPMYEEKS